MWNIEPAYDMVMLMLFRGDHVRVTSVRAGMAAEEMKSLIPGWTFRFSVGQPIVADRPSPRIKRDGTEMMMIALANPIRR